jgi:transposase
MKSALQITTERVDDLPVLFWVLHDRLGIGAALDALLTRHGNWSGLSAGQTLEVWLTHILSEHNHFMSPVQDWANQRPETLARFLGQPLRATDLIDDRLGALTRFLSRDEVWHPLEAQVNQTMLRVYRLPTRRIRLDATTVSLDAHSEVSWLFRRGRSKDYRPDLPQFKVMLAALDPLGAPLAADVVPGNAADDPLYLPIIQRLLDTLHEPGLLFIGDCKMSAVETRAYLQERGHFYLTPLAQVGQVPEHLATWVNAALTGQATLANLYAEDGATVVGQAYELTREPERHATKEQAALIWRERVLIVRSEAFAQAAQRGLAQRLQRAEAALKALTPPRGRGQRQFTEEAPLREALEAIVERYQVHGLLTVAVHEQIERKEVQGYRGQTGRVEERRRYQVRVWRNQAAVEAHERTVGWRAYVTNAPVTELPLTEAIQVYWDEWLVERDMARLKGRPLSLAPVWVTRDDHALGLTRLLTLALRVLAVAEYQVRRQLQSRRQELKGLYPGQPQRGTARPTTERLLKAFGNLTLTIMRNGKQAQRHLTPLSRLQEDILDLLGCPRDLYQQLVHDSG